MLVEIRKSSGIQNTLGVNNNNHGSYMDYESLMFNTFEKQLNKRKVVNYFQNE